MKPVEYKLTEDQLNAESICWKTTCDACPNPTCKNLPTPKEIYHDLLAYKANIHELCERIKPLLASVNGECYQGKDIEESMVFEIRHFMQAIGEYDAIIRDDE